MKKIFKTIMLALLTCMMLACNNELSEVESNNSEEENSQSEEIILGEKRDNPFLLSKARAVNSEINANYVYFRIRLSDVSNIDILESVLGELNTVPLDYEIQEGGCINPENLESADYTPWFYSMITIDNFRKIENLGEVEIIDEMYLSEDDLEKFTEIDKQKQEEARLLWFNYTTARPTGYVYFYDEVKAKNIPLAGVKVIVSQWCHVKSVYTDSNGYYDIGEDFTSCWQNTANVKIVFETTKDCIYPGWSIVKANYNSGDTNISQLAGNNIYLKKNTKQALYGVLINATTMYRKYASSLGVTDPQNLKFWACSNMNGGITLMRDVIVADSAVVSSVIGTCITPGAGTILGTITGTGVAAYLPDIMISLNSNYATKTESITECVFHEMAHASHFTSIGFGKVTYWNEEYINMLGGWMSVLKNGSSPLENCYNDGKSEQVCFIESWGYFLGYYLTNIYYSDNKTYYNYNFLLKGKKKNCNNFYFHVYNKLTDKITVSQIFAPYKYFDVQSINSWYAKLKDLYNQINNCEDIKNIFMEEGITL